MLKQKKTDFGLSTHLLGVLWGKIGHEEQCFQKVLNRRTKGVILIILVVIRAMIMGD